MTIQLASNSPIKMHNLSFLKQSERNFLIIGHMFKLSVIFTSDELMIIRKMYYKFCSLNSPSNTTLSPTLENTTRAAHS
jgi:hypothetical protein